jgi:hypothetical protein
MAVTRTSGRPPDHLGVDDREFVIPAESFSVTHSLPIVDMLFMQKNLLCLTQKRHYSSCVTMQCGVLCDKSPLQGEWAGSLGQLHRSRDKVELYIFGEHCYGNVLQCSAHAAEQHQTSATAGALALSGSRCLMQYCAFSGIVTWCCKKVLQRPHVPFSFVRCCQ